MPFRLTFRIGCLASALLALAISQASHAAPTEQPKETTLPEKKLFLPSNWVWTKVEAVKEAPEHYRGECILPQASENPARKIHVFARVTFL